MPGFIIALLTVAGLTVFETITSFDNAVINAEVLGTMREKSRRWFLLWGMLIAVFFIRGVLPWLIVWASLPGLGPVGALTATFSSDPAVIQAVKQSAPLLQLGGGVFLLLLFCHWLFLEPKSFGLPTERFFMRQGVWFFAVASLLLLGIVWESIQISPLLAFSAVAGSTAFFITHGFKQNAELQERELLHSHSGLSDVSKILYLEAIDATFSIDSVLGAFAFTLSVPLILLGNGFGALIVRWLTVSNIERVKRYPLLKNGAMYAVLFLGVFMVLEAFGADVPEWASPVCTISVIALAFWASLRHPIAATH